MSICAIGRLGLLGEALLDVADAHRGGLHGLHDARRLLRTLAGAALELLARTLGPGLRGGGGQVLLEVVGGARRVGPVDRRDLGVRQGGAAVQRGDRRVVPRGDLAPLKILASTSPLTTSLSTPSRL